MQTHHESGAVTGVIVEKADIQNTTDDYFKKLGRPFVESSKTDAVTKLSLFRRIKRDLHEVVPFLPSITIQGMSLLIHDGNKQVEKSKRVEK